MGCYHPIPAFRNQNGTIDLHKESTGAVSALQLPCGTCIGCRQTRAQHWALRCHLESLEHKHTCVTTLTYDDAHLPPTLQKRDLQLWLKRLRKEHASARPRRARSLKFYACGEYGEQFGRPHYHVILFGLKYDTGLITDTWVDRQRNEIGITYTDNVSPEAINYVVNYTQKKAEWRHAIPHERIDYTTGEIYTWTPPFQQMSRRPGIGTQAKQHWRSWAEYAVSRNVKISVPRYYKEAYNENVTPEEREETEWKKYQRALTRHTLTQQQLDTKERIHYARNKAFAALRKYE